MSQHMEALAKANLVRFKRADLKEEILKGKTTVQAILRNPPPYASTMSVEELLKAQRRWGPRRAQKLLGLFDIRGARALGELTTRQRKLLAQELDH